MFDQSGFSTTTYTTNCRHSIEGYLDVDVFEVVLSATRELQKVDGLTPDGRQRYLFFTGKVIGCDGLAFEEIFILSLIHIWV